MVTWIVKDSFPNFSIKNTHCDTSLECKTVVMKGHNMCFYWEIRKIVWLSELFLLPLLIWSSELISLQQARAEQEEEFISNTLLKKIQLLKKEKESLAMNYEQEEEFLTNDLSRKLLQVGTFSVSLKTIMHNSSWIHLHGLFIYRLIFVFKFYPLSEL